MDARMPKVNSAQAPNCPGVGQWPSQAKEYSKANSVSLTMSWPHRLALSRWLATFHKIVASQVEPKPASARCVKDQAPKRARGLTGKNVAQQLKAASNMNKLVFRSITA